MKKRIALGISSALFCGVVGFNACNPPHKTTQEDRTRLSNTSTAGNPLAPISSKTISTLCQVLTQCHSIQWVDCESGILQTPGISANLGADSFGLEPFSAFAVAEEKGQITANAPALEQCTGSIQSLSCADVRVREAYQQGESQPFAMVPALLNLENSSCRNVATVLPATRWSWSNVAGASSLNFSATQNSSDPQIATLNAKIYSTWIENNAGYNVRVAVTDGTSPVRFVDGNSANGLNFNGSRTAQTPFLLAASGKLYAAWIENNGSRDVVRVKVYSGDDNSPSWTAVDNGSLNRSATGSASAPELITFNSRIYAIWAEKPSSVPLVRVAVYNGTDSAPAWSFIDGNVGTGSISFDATQSSLNPRLAVSNSNLFATWSETSAANGIRKIRVARFNGSLTAPNWSFVDGGTERGLNFDPGQNAQNPHLVSLNGNMYLAWQEWNSPSSEQIRAVVFNGSTWSWLDGGGSRGLNWNLSADAQVPQWVIRDSTLFLTWREQVSGRGIVRVRQFNGNLGLPSWSFIDGDSDSGMNMTSGDAGFSSKRNPSLVSLGSKLFLIWNEGNRIRLKAASPQ